MNAKKNLFLILILFLLIFLKTGVVLAEFNYSIDEISSELRDKMINTSWREGCPVSFDDLSYLTLTHIGFDDKEHTGELIVHSDRAIEVIDIFKELFLSGFKIEKMRLASTYEGDDFASMEDNNTSAFNCRQVPGTSRWSKHSYGVAIDINPVINPWIRDTDVLPLSGRIFSERSPNTPGMVYKNDISTEAFLKRGWRWGGNFQYDGKDYQHFDKMF